MAVTQVRNKLSEKVLRKIKRARVASKNGLFKIYLMLSTTSKSYEIS